MQNLAFFDRGLTEICINQTVFPCEWIHRNIIGLLAQEKITDRAIKSIADLNMAVWNLGTHIACFLELVDHITILIQ